MRQLILGGVRSGKSRLAEQQARERSLQTGYPVTYLATARAGDGEMARRIEQHRQHRPDDWLTLEIPDARLPAQLQQLLQQPGVILLDCLTLWLTQVLCEDLADEEALSEAALQRVDQLLDELVAVVSAGGVADLILVSNETGLGIMPLDALTRAYGDRAGLLHQRLASVCERVIFTVAGMPLVVKGSGFNELY
ncbi:bifunctional adenosylcobinamide kinase/adenosylcobinamide-phosphate guanylyltransferase [Marinospirillum alkaliphilum]|uniref:Bifunctional adenosylcobalamin biosynthesis protein n=1 Tax=Marinospirillum alkaliphilum DSM 21637 TaxID=1122209 RepID=A0A1K1XJQ6_9GAMM|nr:bifunctional adenosylcobinamide kinase/adenosylcobinamide-phosphate guanylyltransferase [Marinospirillum alkaliphilum]SFX49921.1 adenosylcobinamide kinase /adenosylcobinamide-phosphate guanylyltransferase [Marinospirillum alkaliphilum DSM 21637]